MTDKANERAEELLEKFKYAFDENANHFTRMANAHKSYQSKIDVDVWPTQARIPLPFNWSAVEQQMPFIMNYLFPQESGIEMIPLSETMDVKKVESIEDYLWYVATSLMKLRDRVYLSAKDCLRYGVGYGLIEYGYVSVQNVSRRALYREQTRLAERTAVAFKRNVYPQYTYIHPQRVVPMPDGSDTDGPMRADHFVLRSYTEDAFKQFVQNTDMIDLTEAEIEEIIDDSRNAGFDSRLEYGAIMARIAGKTHTKRLKDDVPVLVPVLIHYGLTDHTWLVPDKKIIMEKKAPEGETLLSDLVKYSGWPDGEEWFPVGPYEVSEPAGMGANIFYNAMVDLAAYAINPTRIINKSAFGDESIPPIGPNQDIFAYGDAGKAITFAELPQFPQALFAMGDILKGEFGRGWGNPEQLQQAIPGLVRGGSNALEMLLSSSTGKQLLAAMVIKSGGYEDTINKAFIKLQEMMTDEGDSFIVQRSTANRGREFVRNTVTLEDMAHAMRVSIKLPVAKFNSAQTRAERFSFFDRAIKYDHLFDPTKLFEYIGEDKETVRSMMFPEDVVEENKRRQAEASMQNMEAMAQQGRMGRGEQQATSPAQQAEQGAGRAV